MLNAQLGDGMWMRVVDAEAALAARPYGARGMLRLALQGDELCPWNNGTYVVETDGPTAQVARKDVSADLELTPNALASLISGSRSASHLQRAGLLRAKDDEAVRVADSIFRTEHRPFEPDGF